MYEVAEAYFFERRKVDFSLNRAQTDQEFYAELAAAIECGDFENDSLLQVIIGQNPIVRLTRDNFPPYYDAQTVQEAYLAKSWTPLAIALAWCEMHGLPLPRRWRQAANRLPLKQCEAERYAEKCAPPLPSGQAAAALIPQPNKPRGAPRKRVNECLEKYEQSPDLHASSMLSAAEDLVRWAGGVFETKEIPRASTVRQAISELKKRKKSR